LIRPALRNGPAPRRRERRRASRRSCAASRPPVRSALGASKLAYETGSLSSSGRIVSISASEPVRGRKASAALASTTTHSRPRARTSSPGEYCSATPMHLSPQQRAYFGFKCRVGRRITRPFQNPDTLGDEPCAQFLVDLAFFDHD